MSPKLSFCKVTFERNVRMVCMRLFMHSTLYNFCTRKNVFSFKHILFLNWVSSVISLIYFWLLHIFCRQFPNSDKMSTASSAGDELADHLSGCYRLKDCILWSRPEAKGSPFTFGVELQKLLPSLPHLVNYSPLSSLTWYKFLWCNCVLTLAVITTVLCLFVAFVHVLV